MGTYCMLDTVLDAVVRIYLNKIKQEEMSAHERQWPFSVELCVGGAITSYSIGDSREFFLKVRLFNLNYAE